ncbi:unnamed protein product [Closterium sp. NIES-53]
MALRPSSVPMYVPLPPPPESSLPAVPDPESGRAHAARLTVSRLLATVVTDPTFESTAASARVAELVEFADACRLDYGTAVVAESESSSPSFVKGECALGTDVLDDRQEDFEYLSATVPCFASMLVAPEGDPDAPDIPTPRSYAEAITVPPSRANIVDGMWIFIVKRLLGSPPAFKARYVARGFSQQEGVDYFQTFSPTPKMTTLWVLLHVAAQPDYELDSLDFSTAFLQGSLHEEIWLRRPPGFIGTSGMGLVLGGWGPAVLTGHADTSWVDDLATQRSSQGYTFSLGSGSVSWRSTRSSLVLGSNNKAMIAFCEEHRLEHGTKHIALRYFLARELQQRGQLCLAYVATRANTADIFTKALPPAGGAGGFGARDSGAGGGPSASTGGASLGDSLNECRDPASCPASLVSRTPGARLVCPSPCSPSTYPWHSHHDTSELVGFAATYRHDYISSLVSDSACSPFVGGENDIGCDILEDRQVEMECLAGAIPHLTAMLLAPKGDPDARDIPTPRFYAEAITCPYSSQWQTAMDAEMASWKSTGTYSDAVPPLGANMVYGMWIFRVKRPPGSLPVFKARYPTTASLRSLSGALQVANTLGTTHATLGFAPSTTDPSLFLRAVSTLPPFYILVYVDDLVFATAENEALALVKAELQKRRTCTNMDDLRIYLGLHIIWERTASTITLPQVHMVQQVLKRFRFQSTRSSSVLGSSYDAEIYVWAMAAQELRWLTYLLADLGERPRSPPVLYVNTADIFTIALESGDHQRF